MSIDTSESLLGFTEREEKRLPDRRAPVESGSDTRPLVVIGASAGGPAALGALLGGLRSDFAAGIVVIQHVDPDFAPGLAEWLGHQTPLEVRLARNGDSPRPGLVLLAGKAGHLVFQSASRLTYSSQPAETYCPSIDLFFQSTARYWRGSVFAVLLTGMGRDGAAGLLSLRSKGHHTMAQDQASSAVYGMPKAAAEAGAATEILAVSNIADRLQRLVNSRPKIHV